MRRCGALVGLLVAVTALAGCASTAGRTAPQAAAQRLLDAVVLPAGAAPLDASRIPTGFQSDEIGCAGLVQRSRYWLVPRMSADAAQTWFEGHVPAGLRSDGGGSGGDGSGETMTDTDYAVTDAGIAAAGSRLVVMAVSDGSGSAVRARAQVVPPSGCRASRLESDHGYPGLHGGPQVSPRATP